MVMIITSKCELASWIFLFDCRWEMFSHRWQHWTLFLFKMFWLTPTTCGRTFQDEIFLAIATNYIGTSYKLTMDISSMIFVCHKQVKNDKCPTINGGYGQEVMGNKDKVFEEAKVREGKQVMGKKCWLIEEEDGTFTNWEDVGSGSPQPPSSSSRRGDLGVNGSSSSAAPPPMLSINDLGLPNTNNQELPAFCNLQQHNVPTARTRREEPQVPVEKRCTLCMRTASPLWRNGPLGLKVRKTNQSLLFFFTESTKAQQYWAKPKRSSTIWRIISQKTLNWKREILKGLDIWSKSDFR